MATINRTGVVSFGDASLSVWEEGIADARRAGGWKAAQAWELQFKRDVFARIVQQLNWIGFMVEPNTYIFTGNNNRYARKGDLRADLKLCGRHITLEFFQNVNAPERPDHAGRYQPDKEGHMPYLVRLEMERTRTRIRDYLCGVMEGYTFDAKRRSIYRKPLERTALRRIEEHYAESSHFKGNNWDTYKASAGMSYNLGSADKSRLEHGQRVWFFDWHGRIQTGTAFYNIGNMWWVVTGKYDYRNIAGFELYTSLPENFRVKRNAKLRRKRLEGLLADAVKRMDFERAALLRDIAFPKGERLFVVWHREHKCYHRANFQGYANDIVDAGRFTADEVKGWANDQNEVRDLEVANA